MCIRMQDGSTAQEEKLLATVNRLQGEIEKMTVNLKAIERFVQLSLLRL